MNYNYDWPKTTRIIPPAWGACFLDSAPKSTVAQPRSRSKESVIKGKV